MDSVPGRVEKVDKLSKETLKCAICLEMYRNPRSLSCLHTFCQCCLESLIRRNSAMYVEKNEVECPVCHSGTTAPSGARGVEEWAKRLPVGSFPHVTHTESESTSVCSHCAAVDEVSDSNALCFDCNEYLCQKCAKIHAKVASTKHHNVCSLSDLEIKPPSVQFSLGNIEYCKEHSTEQVKFFCQGHHSLCCSTCAFESHRSCERVVGVKDVEQGFNSRRATHRLTSSLEAIQSRFEGHTNILETNAENIEDSITSIKQEVKDMRDAAVEKMDQIVRDVSMNADQLRDDHQIPLSDRITGQKSLQAAIITSRFMVESVLEHGSETQIFIAVQKIEDQLKKYEGLLQEEQARASNIEFHLKTSDLVQSFINASEKLAHIEVTETKIESVTDDIPNCPDEDYVGSDVLEVDEELDTTALSQNDTNDLTPILDCHLEKVAMVNVGTKRGLHDPQILGLSYLPDGRIAYIDKNNSLCCLMDGKFKVVTDVKLPYKPLSIVTTESNELIVVTEGKMLQFVAVGNKSMSLSRSIQCNRQPYCIALLDKSKLVVGWQGEGIGVISLTDGTDNIYLDRTTSGSKVKIATCDAIAVDSRRSRIYHTVCDRNTMECIQLDGTQRFTYTNAQLNYPTGVTLDRDGNVYVCSVNSGVIHQISPDGNLVKVMDVGLKYPYAISYHRAGDQLAVCNNYARSQRKLAIVRFVE